MAKIIIILSTLQDTNKVSKSQLWLGVLKLIELGELINPQ
jgi:hypothetical protein